MNNEIPYVLPKIIVKGTDKSRLTLEQMRRLYPQTEFYMPVRGDKVLILPPLDSVLAPRQESMYYWQLPNYPIVEVTLSSLPREYFYPPEFPPPDPLEPTITPEVPSPVVAPITPRPEAPPIGPYIPEPAPEKPIPSPDEELFIPPVTAPSTRWQLERKEVPYKFPWWLIILALVVAAGIAAAIAKKKKGK